MENPIVEALKQLFAIPYSENEEDFVLMRRRSGMFEQVVDGKRDIVEYNMTINHVLGAGHISGSVEGRKFRLVLPHNQMGVAMYEGKRKTFHIAEDDLIEIGNSTWKDLSSLPF